MKRSLAILLLSILLLSLAACSASNDSSLKQLLTTYEWEAHGDYTVRLSPDGSGVQYDSETGRVKVTFRWELSGDTLHFTRTDNGENSDFGTFTVLDFNKYVITLRFDDDFGMVVKFCRTTLNDR